MTFTYHPRTVNYQPPKWHDLWWRGGTLWFSAGRWRWPRGGSKGRSDDHQMKEDFLKECQEMGLEVKSWETLHSFPIDGSVRVTHSFKFRHAGDVIRFKLCCSDRFTF